ncbi:nucleotidyltransferase family protein [Alcaligenes sp. SDU_A2]|uniref:nucleotidyltransferase family protein n=1 Tax=Alcaligenes sp. SDU_A2 TaxID=3136634 RepID=UPI00311DBEAB
MTEIEPVQGVTGLVLAAGLGRRFDPSGQQLKLLAPMPDGGTVLRRVCETALQALEEVVVICDVHENAVRQELDGLALCVLRAEQAERGMGVTLKAGVRASMPSCGWLVLLADMPWVQVGTLAALASVLRQGAGLVRPSVDGQPGNPVGFGAAWRQRLLALPDMQGARSLLDAYPQDTVWVPVADAGIRRDVDVPADLDPSLP